MCRMMPRGVDGQQFTVASGRAQTVAGAGAVAPTSGAGCVGCVYGAVGV
jgi:hypothetical protein